MKVCLHCRGEYIDTYDSSNCADCGEPVILLKPWELQVWNKMRSPRQLVKLADKQEGKLLKDLLREDEISFCTAQMQEEHDGILWEVIYVEVGRLDQATAVLNGFLQDMEEIRELAEMKARVAELAVLVTVPEGGKLQAYELMARLDEENISSTCETERYYVPGSGAGRIGSRDGRWQTKKYIWVDQKHLEEAKAVVERSIEEGAWENQEDQDNVEADLIEEESEIPATGFFRWLKDNF